MSNFLPALHQFKGKNFSVVLDVSLHFNGKQMEFLSLSLGKKIQQLDICSHEFMGASEYGVLAKVYPIFIDL